MRSEIRIIGRVAGVMVEIAIIAVGDDRNRGDGDFGPRSGGGRRRNN